MTDFRITGGTVDGNGVNQTGTALSGDGATIPGGGIFRYNCTLFRRRKLHLRLHPTPRLACPRG